MVLVGELVDSSSENGNENQPSALRPQSTQNRRQKVKAHTNPTRAGIPNADQNPEMLLKLFLEAVKKLWHHIKRATNFVMVDLGGYQLFDRLAQWCVQHPQAAVCLLAAGLVTFLPLLLLLGFVFSTILMTLTGFLVLEGTLITILSMMLFGLLGALLIVMLFFGVIGGATYFGFARIYDLFGNVESHKSALNNFLQKENPHNNHEIRVGASHTQNSRNETTN